jgi:hypothetical protein
MPWRPILNWFFSDRHLFGHLHKTFTEEEMGVLNWSMELYEGFLYLAETKETDPQLVCKWTKRYCFKDFKHDRYRRIEGMKIMDTAEKRAEPA